MILEAFKHSEPVTLLTDGLLGIECLVCSCLLLAKRKSSPLSRTITAWALGYISLGIFAINGSLSHYTTSYDVYSITWPLCVVFGGVCVFFFQIALMLYESDEKDAFKTWSYSVPPICLAIYLVALSTLNWNFSLFGGYLGVFLFQFLFSYRNHGSESSKSNLYQSIRNFMLVVVVLGIIQVAGKAAEWNFYYGPDSQYLFQVGNEIFHIAILFPVWYLYTRLKKNLAT